MHRKYSIFYTAAISLGVLLFASGFGNFASALFSSRAAQQREEPLVIATAVLELPGNETEVSQTETPGDDDFLEPFALQEQGDYRSSAGRNISAVKEGNPPESASPDPLAERSARNADISPLPTKEKQQIPERLVIPSINLDAPVIPAEWEVISLAGQQFRRWLAPDEASAGWHTTSALLGTPGNTVINGHHNIHGAIFARLGEIETGDTIEVFSEDKIYFYMVSNVMIVPEKYAPLEVRLENATWIQPSTDERLTLISCWPPETNTHRVIVVASPVQGYLLNGKWSTPE